MSRGIKKKRSKCKEAANNKKAGYEHYDHPTRIISIGGMYQARCLGCETAEPVVSVGPWVAQQALYSAA